MRPAPRILSNDPRSSLDAHLPDCIQDYLADLAAGRAEVGGINARVFRHVANFPRQRRSCSM